MFKRLLYLGYYLKKMDWGKFQKFATHVHERTRRSKAHLYLDAFLSSLKYKISPIEYFNFHFVELNPRERSSFAGTGYMYEYQLRMNPKESRDILEDKLKFLKTYAPFIRHDFLSLDDLKDHPEKAERILANPSGKVVIKHSRGQCGSGVEVLTASDLDCQGLIDKMESTGNDIAESFIIQHPDLMALSPAGLNTLRLITQLSESGEVHFLGARLRITVNSPVDNMAAGNLAAPVNLDTGRVSGPAVYSDITKPEERMHPATGAQIEDFQVPFWKESVEMVTRAALLMPQNRSIGWDVAISEQGPELLEGNHNWCKLLWQLPVRRGLKKELEAFL